MATATATRNVNRSSPHLESSPRGTWEWGSVSRNATTICLAVLVGLVIVAADEHQTVLFILVGLSGGLVGANLTRQRRLEKRVWVLCGNTTLVGALGGGLRRAGVSVVELTDYADLDRDDPRLTNAAAILCADTTMLQNVWAACRWSVGKREGACFRWATLEPRGSADPPPVAHAGRVVWSSTVTAAAVLEALVSGSHAIDVVEVGDGDEVGRFGESLQPLFWVDNGRAHIIVDPRRPGTWQGDLAVVLRRRVFGYRVGRPDLACRRPG